MSDSFRMSVFLILFFLIAPIFAQEVSFHPVTSVNARTIKKGTLALGRAPIGNINSTFLTNSLNYGLFSRFEIGTSPLFYAMKEHRHNYLFKLNFWKGDWVDWSLIYGDLTFWNDLEHSNGEVERADIKLSSTQFAVNIHPPGLKFSFGLFYTKSCGHIKSKDAFIFIASFQCRDESGFDTQYQLDDDEWLTFGVASMREAGITPYEEVVTGAGVGYTRFFPGKPISRPSLGFDRTFDGNNQILFTTTFYEEK